MRRVPAATLSSPTILNSPTWPVLSRCVPPQSSLLNSPIETMRTTSGYFSPKSIMAPALRASASGMFAQPIGSAVEDLGVHFVLDPGQFLAADGRRDWRSRTAAGRRPPSSPAAGRAGRGAFAGRSAAGAWPSGRGGCPGAARASTRAVTVAPSSIRPSRRWPRWSVKPPSTWVSITSKRKPRPTISPESPTWPPISP